MRQELMFENVKAFHEKFGIGPKRYEDWTHHDHNYRIGFMEEEIGEYVTAYDEDNKASMLDALVDLVYVSMGTAYMLGWDFTTGFDRVHAANMAKVRVKSSKASKRGHSWDVGKPPGWQAPDLSDLV